MKKLMILPLALSMFSLAGGGSQAGLLDKLFETTTRNNPQGVGRIVWHQNGMNNAPITLASRQAPAGIELAPGEHLVPSPDGDNPAVLSARPVGLYPRVQYEDLDNIHPCAVKMVVQVQDPCQPRRDPCSKCRPAPRYVLVEICVPPSGCRKIEISRSGNKVEYDYGHYEVEIKSKRGIVVVNYDD